MRLENKTSFDSLLSQQLFCQKIRKLVDNLSYVEIVTPTGSVVLWHTEYIEDSFCVTCKL